MLPCTLRARVARSSFSSIKYRPNNELLRSESAAVKSSRVLQTSHCSRRPVNTSNIAYSHLRSASYTLHSAALL